MFDRDARIADIFTARGSEMELHAIDPSADMRTAAQVMRRKNVRSLVIMNVKGEPIGIVTDHDVTKMVAEYGHCKCSVAQMMSRAPETCRGDSLIVDVQRTMTERRFRHVIIVDGKGKAVGMCSGGDISWYSGVIRDQLNETFDRRMGSGS